MHAFDGRTDRQTVLTRPPCIQYSAVKISKCSPKLKFIAQSIDQLCNLCNQLIQEIFRSLVLARLSYASAAWRGFTECKNRQLIDEFLRRCTPSGFCSTNPPAFHDLCTEADRNLFHKILSCPNHVLHHLLSPVPSISQTHSLRPRAHNRVLPEHSTRLIDRNFIVRLLSVP